MMKGVNYRITPNGLKNTNKIMKQGVLLPVHHGMNEEMFSRLHSTITEYINKFK